MNARAKACKVHWVRYEPTFYYDEFLRAVSADPAIDLTVHYDVAKVGHYHWRKPLRSGYPSRVRPRGQWLDWELLHCVRRDADAFYFMAGWWTPTMIAALTLLIALGRRFVVFSDTPKESGRMRMPVKRLRAAWLRLVFRRAHAVLGTGQVGVAALVRMGCPADKTVNFPWFVPLPPASRTRRPPVSDREPVRFFGCGRLAAEKGFDVVIRAFAAAVGQTHGPARLVIAGEGEQKAELMQLSERLGVGDRVEFAGWLEHEATLAQMRQSHVFVHAPTRLDPFPVSVLEAMAYGLPILGSDVAGSVADRVESGENGFVHSAGDATALAEHMCRVLARPETIARLGRRARATAEAWPLERGVELVKMLARQAMSWA